MDNHFQSEEVVKCISEGIHLTSCDKDGFCNFCGCQDDPDEEE